MSCRKGLLTVFALATVIALLAVPVPTEGTSVHEMDCGDVTMVIFSDGIEMNTVESYPVSLHFYNGHPTAVSVKVSDDGSGPVNLSVPSDELLIGPGESYEMESSLSTDRYTSMGDYDITFVLKVSDGVTDPQTGTMTVPISVTSNYSSGTNYNRIMGVFDNSFLSPANNALVTGLVTLLIWVGIALAASSLFLLVLKTLFRITERDSDTLGRSTTVGVFFCIMLYGIYNSLLVMGAGERIVEEIELVSEVLYVLFFALIIWDIYKALITSALRKLEKRGVGGMDTSLIPLFKSIGKIFIILICIAIILSSFGVNFVTLITTAGLTGLGLSFGVKPAINELFSGLIVLITRPFKVGDYVTVGSDERLQVDEIGILRTKFKTGYTMEVATMPNSKIASSKIVNISHNTTMYRNTISLKVPFDSNLTLIKKIVKRVASEHPEVVVDGSVPKPTAVFSACDDGSAIVVTLAFYVKDYDNNSLATAQIREGILREFAERDIRIPLNKMEITIYNKGGQSNAQ